MQRALFSPLAIRELTLRNRIVVSPMLTYCADGGHVNDFHLSHLGKFAAGGAGLVFMESTKIDPAGCSTPRDLGLWKDEFVAPMKRITSLVKRNGAVVGIQLGHSGRKARRSVPWEGRVPMANHPGVDHGEPWELIGPSAVAHDPKYSVPREMSRDDIRKAADQWGEAVRRADEAGFDIVEIHGAHGYLIHQFLSSTANKRTDEYGGSLENRMRFACEVVRRVRQSWPREKPLFFRVSAVDETGWTIDDSVELAKALKKAGVDVIDCSSGGMGEGATASEQAPGYGYQVPYARDIRAGADIMTMAVGMIVHSDHAEEIVQTGSADLVALGREFLHNPNWPIDAAQKLQAEAPFSGIPPAYAYFLEKRSKLDFGVPSTFQRGMNARD
ncbi:MAG TPA: NADH:flavin oxidoreductase/NADH oxidase [Burkholderiales bacterium]|nr:NADH:flavin oxidoreductase/NADH oxidase [Burkholderiales bacterium]